MAIQIINGEFHEDSVSISGWTPSDETEIRKILARMYDTVRGNAILSKIEDFSIFFSLILLHVETGDPDSFDIDLYEMDSMKELAEQFVDEGLFGKIPTSIQFYIDYEAIARDLACDYNEAIIDGQRYIYRCQ